MGYYIDLENLTLDDYLVKLESDYLPPSRLILKENMRERFRYFKNAGIKNVKELIQLLKKKDKCAELSKVEGFSADFLAILLRELNSMLPKPNKLIDFTSISEDTVFKLERLGLNDTLKLYGAVRTKTDRQQLADITGIPEIEILELTKMTDLSRIKWVGATFARMLYLLGIDTAEKVSKADPLKLQADIFRLHNEKSIFKGHIGLNDIKIVVNAANEIPFDIEY